MRWSITTVHTAEWEQFEYDRRVTDWELMRGFEQY
jgi:glutamine synthetase